jgi:hypothetical protein
MLAVGHGLSERVGIRARMVLLPRSKREDLERQITALAVAGGVLPATAAPSGVYAGDWIDLLNWFIENWEVILEIILAIIAIFVGE